MNGGKVYYTLNDILNNNVIKMIQKYNIENKNVDIIYAIRVFNITSGNLPTFTLLNKLKTVNMYLPILCKDDKDDYREDE